MVSEGSSDIRHHFVDMDDLVVSNRRGEQRSLFGFIGLDLLQPGSAYHNLVVHLLHNRSSDGLLRLSLRSVLL